MRNLSSRALGVILGDWRSPTDPAYVALADRIRLLILDGRVQLGARLPAERDLAAHLGLSRTTVSAAYAALRESGFVDSIRGSGSVARLPAGGSIVPDMLATGEVDFNKAVLPAHPAVVEATQRAAANLPSFLHESGFDPLGLRVARQAVADRYTERGLPTDADEVMITIGAQHAISIVARTVLARGDRALVESPSFPHAIEAVSDAGGRIVTVPVTSETGWDEAALEQTFQRTSPVLAYLVADNHNPIGRSMPAELRQKVVDLARAQGTTLIVDETITGLELDGQSSPPPFAVHGRAVLTGSLGKAVWGGLRLGWIRADRELIQRIARKRFSATDLGTPIVEQLALVELLPGLDAILADRREYLRTNRDHLARRIREQLPDWRMPHVAGGIAAWINLGRPVSSQLAMAARAEGLVIATGARFGVDGLFERFVRIPITSPPDVLDRGVDALAAAWRTVVAGPVPYSSGEYAHVV